MMPDMLEMPEAYLIDCERYGWYPEEHLPGRESRVNAYMRQYKLWVQWKRTV